MDWNEPKSNKKGAGANQPSNEIIGYRPGQAEMDAAKMYVVEHFSDFILEKIFALKFEDRNMFCLAIGLIPSLLATGFSQRFAVEGGKDAATAGLQMMTMLEISGHIEVLFDGASPEEQESMRGIIRKHNEITELNHGLVKITFNEEAMTKKAIDQRVAFRNNPEKSQSLIEKIIENQPPEIKEAILATKTMGHEEWAKKYGHLAITIAKVLKGMRKQ